MKILGLVTEYNPFHNGHKYHIDKSKDLTSATHTVAVMSGNFVQRGEPAILDKWTRAEFAISSGVDLVIELPTVFAISSAEYFAYGACSLLDDMGIIDDLVFGSESGNIEDINNVSSLLINSKDEIDSYISKFLDEGFSYPKSRELAIKELTFSNSDLDINLNMPNNILGIEYSKALMHLKSNIKIRTIKRISSDYNDLEIKSSISSATAIRHSVKSNYDFSEIESNVPKDVFEAFSNNKNKLVYSDDFSNVILNVIRRMDIEEIKKIHDVSEGLENKITYEANQHDNLTSLIESLKSKRYTRTRIQRILFKILLNINSSYMSSTYDLKPTYIRVLAFNDKGREILKLLKKTSRVPILTNLDRLSTYDKSISDMLKYDVRATNIYSTFSNIDLNSDFTKRPIYKK